MMLHASVEKLIFPNKRYSSLLLFWIDTTLCGSGKAYNWVQNARNNTRTHKTDKHSCLCKEQIKLLDKHTHIRTFPHSSAPFHRLDAVSFSKEIFKSKISFITDTSS